MFTVQQQILNNIKKRQLLPKGSNVLVAVSGGQDSLCLLYSLIQLAPTLGVNIIAAHCDHAWATDDGIADHVNKVCKELNVLCITKRASNLKETEQAARHWRYQALVEIANEVASNHVLTGHTRTDQAETVIYNLSRGSGTKGLSAMPWTRELSNSVQLVRPMLNISRPETLAVCQDNCIDIWEDVLNESDKYARCRIRKNIMPRLAKEVNTAAELNIANTAEIISSEEDFMHESALALYTQCVTNNRLDITKGFKGAHLAIKRRVAKLFIEQVTGKSTKYKHMSYFLDLHHANKSGVYSGFPNGFKLTVTNQFLQLNK